MSNGSDKLQEWIASRSKNDWRALFVCILISASIWVLRSLTEDATDTFTVPVVFIDTPAGFDLVSSPETTIDLEVTSTGFGLLGQRYFKREKPLEISLSDLPEIDGQQAIATNGLYNRARKLTGADRDVLSIAPDSLFVTMSKRARKEVPIVYVNTENLGTGEFVYRTSDNANGKVFVSGAKQYLDTLAAVYTSPFEITETATYQVSLTPLSGLTFEGNGQIEVKVVVDKMAEASFTVPIAIPRTLQSSSITLVPNEVIVSVSGAQSKLDELKPDFFTVTFDAEDLESLISAGINKVPLRIERQPEDISSVLMSPGRIEFFMQR
ncbi:MAG: hypothetical protein P8H59_03640 [Flavobacteriales bacterium]|nr:hypothetical protein [Flavobacteriales bacterium]MDG1780019.1 hypothetical protein [Flavobacteriales bacterium]MDG2247144.1 hypothetical protein [Flavobacteriales bacterium]